MTNSAKRKQDLNDWLKDCFNNTSFSLTSLKNDASFRRYWRINHADKSFVLMDAPPDKEPLDNFLNTTEKLSQIKVNVPKLYFQNKPLGALVLSDFGDTDYSAALNPRNARKLYQNAIDSLIDIQSMQDIASLPHFDEDHIRMELEIFDEWFLGKHLNRKDKAHTANYDYLIEMILSQPTVAIHRDYHSRNLMLTDKNSPGILDHQDMMQGPISYDMVSLLRDCYIEWDASLIKDMNDYYLYKSEQTLPLFQTWFDITGVQRHLKAIGIFARLNYLYHNPNYLKYMALPLKYIQSVSDNYKELTDISKLVKQLI